MEETKKSLLRTVWRYDAEIQRIKSEYNDPSMMEYRRQLIAEVQRERFPYWEAYVKIVYAET
jgi:hypothetical protein